MYDIEDINSKKVGGVIRSSHRLRGVTVYNSQWGHVCYIGSAPRLAEDVAPQVPVSLPALARKRF